MVKYALTIFPSVHRVLLERWYHCVQYTGIIIWAEFHIASIGSFERVIHPSTGLPAGQGRPTQEWIVCRPCWGLISSWKGRQCDIGCVFTTSSHILKLCLHRATVKLQSSCSAHCKSYNNDRARTHIISYQGFPCIQWLTDTTHKGVRQEILLH